MYHIAPNVGPSYFAPTAMALLACAAPASVNARRVGEHELPLFSGSPTSGCLGEQPGLGARD